MNGLAVRPARDQSRAAEICYTIPVMQHKASIIQKMETLRKGDHET